MSSGENVSSGQGRLGFVEHALGAFEFLLLQGFEVARREPSLVVFKSNDVFVNIYHGRSSYQVGLEIGRLESGDKYSLHEILAAWAPTERDKARCATTDPKVLRRCLNSIAAVVERICDSLLAGDASAFENLRADVAPRRETATLEAQFGATLDRADQAWESKDLTRAQELYQKARPALSKTQRRRLKYLVGRAEAESGR